MSDTATIIDNYLTARGDFAQVIDCDVIPKVIDYRERIWMVRRSHRQCGHIGPSLYTKDFGQWICVASHFGHEVIHEDSDVTIVREFDPNDGVIYILSTPLRDDKANDKECHVNRGRP